MEKKLSFKAIESLQKQYGYTEMQKSINSGQCWLMEGSMGRGAMGLLEAGVCMLPKQVRIDYYGSKVPSREQLKNGSKGTFGNCQEFWSKVVNGEIFMEDFE